MLNISDYIMHYGVKGMRWGQHLFGKDYTIGGKSFPKGRVRADNKKAFEYGRKATITGRAKIIADRKKEKAKNRMLNNPYSDRLKNKYKEASSVANNLNKEYVADHNRAKEHIKKLRHRYGRENVSNLVYKKFGNRYVVNEPIHSTSELATHAALNALSAGLMATGAVPISVYSVPSTKGANGRAKYSAELHRTRYENRRAHAN